MPKTLNVSARYDEGRNANVVSLPDGEEIWWEVPDVPALGSKRINDDFTLSAVLPMAMKSGNDIYVDGTVDRQLVIWMEKTACAWSQWKPGLYRPVQIGAREIKDHRPAEGAAGSIVALSGGIDSTFMLRALSREERYELFEPPAETITIRGFDVAYSEFTADDPGLVMTRQSSAYFNLRNLAVRTNWNDYCIDYLMFHPLGLAAVFHQFNARYRAAYFAADYTYAQDYEAHPKGSAGVTNQLLGSSALPVATVGARFQRSEKTLMLLQDETLKDLIEPCMGRNVATNERCGRCLKCLWIDIIRFHNDRVHMTFANEWRLSLRILRYLRLKSELAHLLSNDTVQMLKGEGHLIRLALAIRKMIYLFRKLRRRLITGRTLKNALGRFR